MQQAVSLLELNQLIKSALDDNLQPYYWIIAEIGELKQAAQGHAYLDLVEKSGNRILAKTRANIWSYSYRTIAGRFQAVTGQPLKAGMKILAQVSVTYHELYGISLNVKDIDPNFTLGERARIRQEVIEKLTREGLMDLNKRFQLPKVPQRIAIISSATAAGYGDFMDQLAMNKYGYRIHTRFFQATLQGADAAKTLVSALNQIAKSGELEKFDAVVIIRGGGAQMDLDCFDEYELALAIARCPIPVITGIGHERDETIADLVSHTKMKTPTAAAEFILSGFRDFEELLINALKTLERNTSQTLTMEERRLRDFQSQIKNLAYFKLQQANETLRYKVNRLQSMSTNRCRIDNIKLQNIETGLKRYWKNQLEAENKHLENLLKDIKKLDPKSFLKRGYTRSEVNGKPIHQTEINLGDLMVTYSNNKTIKSIIQNIEQNGKD